jgi:predicted nucleic acid-binding protein
VIRYVADASVAVKWVLRGPEERLVPEAVALLSSLVSGEIQVMVPDLFWIEVGNVLWKAVRRTRCTREVAESSLHEIKQQGLITAPSRNLVEAALGIAVRFQSTVYDSIYVALASRSGAPLITADERLANALAAHFPVRWLGSL